MSDSVWPHRQQSPRLPRPWDSPGKNTGVGCHFLLQCMKMRSESEVVQSSLTLPDPMDCSLPGSSVHGIFQARVLLWRCTNKNYELNCLSVKFIMATHSSILAWRIPWTGESGRLQSMGSKRSNMTEQLSKFICLRTNSQYLGMWLYLEIGFLEI